MRIFISYRRDDTAGYAGRLYDRLRTTYDADNVFMDIDTIPLGEDFVEVIEEAVGSCDALLALIGREWLTIADGEGKRRLDDPDDFTRLEIATALEREVRVIPVLLRGATMPDAASLPDNLKALARRQALAVNDASFHQDVDRLIDALGQGAKKSPPATKAATRPPKAKAEPVAATPAAGLAGSDLPLRLDVGDKVGQYTILEVVSRGDLSILYRAEQTSLGRTVAIRMMPAYFAHDPMFLQRFTAEITATARLQHPRILPIYDVGELEGRPYVVTSFLGGGSLEKRLRDGKLPAGDVTRIVEQVADAVDHANKSGFIHGDLQPTNILLDTDGNVFVSNFGLARLIDSAASETSALRTTKPAYMAPERVTEAAGSNSPAVDVYALGALTFQMLTGRVPFRGDTPLQVMMAHVTQPVPDVTDECPELNAQVNDVIKRAMAKEPRDRYPSAGALAEALRQAIEG